MGAAFREQSPPRLNASASARFGVDVIVQANTRISGSNSHRASWLEDLLFALS